MAIDKSLGKHGIFTHVHTEAPASLLQRSITHNHYTRTVYVSAHVVKMVKSADSMSGGGGGGGGRSLLETFTDLSGKCPTSETGPQLPFNL